MSYRYVSGVPTKMIEMIASTSAHLIDRGEDAIFLIFEL